jgi:exodeoxyribonuclease V alpha subunit
MEPMEQETNHLLLPDPEMTLDPLQEEAINTCCDIDNRIVAVTGAAGSGKTTILKRVYNAFDAGGYKVVLCAPTGKAAKRIFEATGIPAMTVHRLLAYSHPGDPDPKTGKVLGYSVPTHTRANPIPYDVVLCDEYAMVNDEVHRNLIDALPPACVIRMFGDDNQLAPIEENKLLATQPSNFLKILANPKFKSITLKTVFRQGKDSGILLNLQRILKGQMPVKNEQWTQKITDQPVDELRNYIFEQLDLGQDFSKPGCQIIVPQKQKSWVCSNKLNSMIQGLFHNKTEPCLFIPRKEWEREQYNDTDGQLRLFVGDKVIYTANQYDLGIFNGESGVVIEIDDDSGEIIIDFGDREQAIPPVLEVMTKYGKTTSIDPRRELDLAYAITTHKSQGSQYPHVVYILNKSNMFMIGRRNFYTACSRASEKLHLIADQRGLSQGVYKRD